MARETGAPTPGETREGWVRDNWGNPHEAAALSADVALRMLLYRCAALGGAMSEGRVVTAGDMITVQEAAALARRLEDAPPRMDAAALAHIVQHGTGPYTKGGQSGYWHKENHAGPATCAGCAVEAALA